MSCALLVSIFVWVVVVVLVFVVKIESDIKLKMTTERNKKTRFELWASKKNLDIISYLKNM